MVCRANVAESEVQQEPKTSVANDESKRWRGGPSTQARIEERVNYAYALLLEGNTRRANAELIASKFNVSIRTAHDDLAKAMVLLREERTADREELLNIVTANRLALLRRSIRKGNYQVACHILDSLGRAAGELSQEQAAAAAPQLQITVEDRRQQG